MKSQKKSKPRTVMVQGLYGVARLRRARILLADGHRDVDLLAADLDVAQVDAELLHELGVAADGGLDVQQILLPLRHDHDAQRAADRAVTADLACLAVVDRLQERSESVDHAETCLSHLSLLVASSPRFLTRLAHFSLFVNPVYSKSDDKTLIF